MGSFKLPVLVSGVTDDPATALRPFGRMTMNADTGRPTVHDGQTPGGQALAFYGDGDPAGRFADVASMTIPLSTEVIRIADRGQTTLVDATGETLDPAFQGYSWTTSNSGTRQWKVDTSSDDLNTVMFGARGGVVDDTMAVKAAFASLRSNMSIEFPVVSRVNSSVTVADLKKVRLSGPGGIRTPEGHNALTFLNCTGSISGMQFIGHLSSVGFQAETIDFAASFNSSTWTFEQLTTTTPVAKTGPNTGDKMTVTKAGSLVTVKLTEGGPLERAVRGTPIALNPAKKYFLEFDSGYAFGDAVAATRFYGAGGVELRPDQFTDDFKFYMPIQSSSLTLKLGTGTGIHAPDLSLISSYQGANYNLGAIRLVSLVNDLAALSPDTDPSTIMVDIQGGDWVVDGCDFSQCDFSCVANLAERIVYQGNRVRQCLSGFIMTRCDHATAIDNVFDMGFLDQNGVTHSQLYRRKTALGGDLEGSLSLTVTGNVIRNANWAIEYINGGFVAGDLSKMVPNCTFAFNDVEAAYSGISVNNMAYPTFLHNRSVVTHGFAAGALECAQSTLAATIKGCELVCFNPVAGYGHNCLSVTGVGYTILDTFMSGSTCIAAPDFGNHSPLIIENCTLRYGNCGMILFNTGFQMRGGSLTTYNGSLTYVESLGITFTNAMAAFYNLYTDANGDTSPCHLEGVNVAGSIEKIGSWNGSTLIMRGNTFRQKYNSDFAIQGDIPTGAGAPTKPVRIIHAGNVGDFTNYILPTSFLVIGNVPAAGGVFMTKGNASLSDTTDTTAAFSSGAFTGGAVTVVA